MTASIHLAYCLDWMRDQPDDSIDLIFGSPPYEAARTYGIEFALRGQAWVDWMVERWREMNRICRGLVAMVVAGRTHKFRWSATPALLMTDLHRAGFGLRPPPIYHRHGIPGSGGPDWWRNDYELIVCTSKGRLPWSDNLAVGQPCKYPTGGAFSHRTSNGSRVDHGIEGKHGRHRGRPPVTNPGNVIACTVGGGHLGNGLAHLNEAPFPESLVEPFIRSFCPPGGVVYDPFAGSGTTLAVAVRCGRRAVGTDVRQSQVELAQRRLNGVQREFV